MKGPGMRVDLDVRRLWRCDVCQTQRKTDGDVTSLACHICSDHPQMTLVERDRLDHSPAEPLDLYLDLHPDDVDAPAFVPVHLRDAKEQESVAEETTADSSTAQQSQEGATAVESEPVVATQDLESNTSSDDPAAAKTLRKKPRRKKRRRKGGDGAS